MQMTADSRNTGERANLIDQALAALGNAIDATSLAAQLAEQVKDALQTGVETPFEMPLNLHRNRAEIRAAPIAPAPSERSQPTRNLKPSSGPAWRQ